MAVLVCLLIMTLGFVTPAAAEKKPILIGLVHTMSGAMSIYGISSRIGAEIAIEEINEAGGVLGRPLKLITRDDKINPQVGLREAKSLVIDKKVDFLTGSISSAVAHAISDYAKKAKVLYFVNIAQSGYLTEEEWHPYIFRINTNTIPYTTFGPADAHAAKWGDKKLIFIGFDYVTAHECLGNFMERYKKFIPEAKVVKEFWPPLGTTDFTPYISAMASVDADGVIDQLYGGGERAFVKQAAPAGIFEKFHVTSSCSGDLETWSDVKKGKTAPIGVLSTCRYPFWDIQASGNKKFVMEHYKRAGFWPSYGAMNEYYTMYILKKAIEKVGAVDTEKLIPVLEGMEFDTWFGPVKIRACDHQAMMPTWIGLIGWGAEEPYWSEEESPPHIINPTRVEDAETQYHSCEYIEKLRKQKK